MWVLAKESVQVERMCVLEERKCPITQNVRLLVEGREPKKINVWVLAKGRAQEERMRGSLRMEEPNNNERVEVSKRNCPRR